MLDIVQDYLGYRNFSYERLDGTFFKIYYILYSRFFFVDCSGSVRGDERFAAINAFNLSGDTFVFLLSTRAGGNYQEKSQNPGNKFDDLIFGRSRSEFGCCGYCHIFGFRLQPTKWYINYVSIFGIQ